MFTQFGHQILHICRPWCHFPSIATAPFALQPLPFLGRLVSAAVFPREGGEWKFEGKRATCRQHLWWESPDKNGQCYRFCSAFLSCFLFPVAISCSHMPKMERSNRNLHQDGFEECRWAKARLPAKRMGWTYGAICFFCCCSLLNLCVKKISSDVFIFVVCFRFPR